MTPSDILLKAADLIEQKGWTQGAFARSIDGDEVTVGSPAAACFCVHGAIRAVGRHLDEIDVARDTLRRALGEAIFFWNDTPGRTKEEVVEALRRAAR